MARPYRPATKAFAAAFIKAGEAALRELGAEPVDDPSFSAWRIDTIGGELRVTVFEDWIACRFEEPASALPHFPQGAINRHSGKWNHHWWDHGFEARDLALVDRFKFSLSCILPESSPAHRR